MKVFRSDQVKNIDSYTIQYEPITSADLMERAARQLYIWFTEKFDRSRRIVVFAGPGNNGGDGLALARMLSEERYDVLIYYVQFTKNTSPDFEINRKRLENEYYPVVNCLTSADQFPVISSDDLIIDAIFGSGLNRPAEGLTADIIKKINLTDSLVISIDIPSGLFGEDNSKNTFDNIIRSDHTLSFQFPKLSFMFAENAQYLGEWNILPIGLDINSINCTESPYLYLEKNNVSFLLKKRNKFDHKGIYGHGLIISGSSDKMGAAVLGASAALRTGIGLITCHIPFSGSTVLQSNIPEAMIRKDPSENNITDIGSTDSFSAVGIGPGIGTGPETQRAVYNLLKECKTPLVMDADALNILSMNMSWLPLLPTGTILTPHVKEFERLTGKSENGYRRLQKQVEFSKKHNCFIVLKGACSSVSTPDGRVFFNSTGNPGMATGGSGDVLTGIILSLLAQGYTPENAAVLGVYLHGLSGDIAAGESCYESIIASDIINCIGKAFNKIREN